MTAAHLDDRITELERRINLIIEHLFPPVGQVTAEDTEPGIVALERAVQGGDDAS